MTLNRRALVAIFPVVLLGYILAAGVTYRNHRNSLISLDRARLAEQLYELQSAFTRYKAFNLGLLNVMRNSNALLLFMHNDGDAYRSEALGIGLQDSVHSMSNGAVQFVSCAIFRPDHTLTYYYDSGQDPFAGLSAQQDAFALQAFAGNATTASGYLADSGTIALVVTAGFVSGAVAVEPLPSQKRSAFMIQIAVRPIQFETLRTGLEIEYGARVELSRIPLGTGPGISEGIRLEPDLYARLTPAAAYLQRPLRRAAIEVSIGCMVMSVMSIGMLLLLVRRYITGPISCLDRQVMEVMAGRRENIEAVPGNDEVGRLSVNVETLHARASGSLHDIQTLYCTDALTGISNRTHFNILSAQMLESVSLAGDHLTLLFIDLDNFKFVNDRYGHEAGDALLKAVAQTIGLILGQVADSCGEARGLCARLSGDEFAVLVRTDCLGSHVGILVDAILDAFKGGFQLATQLYPVTPSIGIASAPRDATTVTQLISCADAAMYQAKATGRNTFAHFSADLMERGRRRGLVEEGLKAIDRDWGFSLVYMPIVNQAGTIVACEALLRWLSPTLGQVSPAEFIPIAESTGLFVDIDNWVLDHAMADYSGLVRLFGDDVVLSINISSAQLYTQSIAARIAAVARKHGLRPSRIELELTETFAAGFNEETRRAVESLRLQGFRISIDDFGVGYTSVQQIIEYPADTIKLDRMIIDRLAMPSSVSRLRSLIAFCHALDMKVIAEGVDTACKAESLMEAQCDGFQGFGITPPLNLGALAIWQARLPGGLAPPVGVGQRPRLRNPSPVPPEITDQANKFPTLALNELKAGSWS